MGSFMRRKRSTTRVGNAKVSGARAVAGDLLRARQAERDEDGEEQDIDPAVLASGAAVVQAMEVYFKSRRLYQEDYPPLQRVLKSFDERMRGHLEMHDTLTVSVASRAIEI